MKIGVDFGGCLASNISFQKYIRELALEGCEIHIITAVNVGGEDWVRAEVFKVINGWKGIFHVHVVIHGMPYTEENAIKTGQDKAKVMQQFGIGFIFDDTELVCRAIRDWGLEALLLKTVPNP